MLFASSGTLERSDLPTLHGGEAVASVFRLHSPARRPSDAKACALLSWWKDEEYGGESRMTTYHPGAHGEAALERNRWTNRSNAISARWRERPNLVPGVRVLRAGDSREYRERLATAVGRVGCEVVEFNEWQDLVQCLRETPLPPVPGETDDIVLLDLRMSGRRLLDRVLSVVGDRVPLVLVAGDALELPPTTGWTVLREPVQADALCGAIVSCALEYGRRGGQS